jgi:hypothetical protein
MPQLLRPADRRIRLGLFGTQFHADQNSSEPAIGSIQVVDLGGAGYHDGVTQATIVELNNGRL